MLTVIGIINGEDVLLKSFTISHKLSGEMEITGETLSGKVIKFKRSTWYFNENKVVLTGEGNDL